MLTTYGCSGSCCSSLFGFVCKQVSFRESLLALLSLLRLQCVLAQMNSNFLVLSSIRPEGPLAFNGIKGFYSNWYRFTWAHLQSNPNLRYVCYIYSKLKMGVSVSICVRVGVVQVILYACTAPILCSTSVFPHFPSDWAGGRGRDVAMRREAGAWVAPPPGEKWMVISWPGAIEMAKMRVTSLMRC